MSDQIYGDSWILHHGAWQDTIAPDLQVNAVITDAPFGERTHKSKVRRNDGVDPKGSTPGYDFWRPNDVHEFVHAWSSRCLGWMAAMTSHDLIPAWEEAYATHGRLAFAPIPCVMRGMTVRMRGDGPSSWTVYLMTARPRATGGFDEWGSLDGAYVGPRSTEAGGGRGKPIWLMNAIVRDYTRPGDLVVDPLAGWGQTIRSCIQLGRRAVGSECDEVAFAEAKRRLERPHQLDMFELVSGHDEEGSTPESICQTDDVEI